MSHGIKRGVITGIIRGSIPQEIYDTMELIVPFCNELTIAGYIEEYKSNA